MLAISSSSYRFAPWLQYRSPSGPVPHQFPVAAISSSSRQVAAISRVVLSYAASSYCALLRPNARAKLAKKDARCFSYRAKWWRREGKKKAREMEPRISWSLLRNRIWRPCTPRPLRGGVCERWPAMARSSLSLESAGANSLTCRRQRRRPNHWIPEVFSAGSMERRAGGVRSALYVRLGLAGLCRVS